MAQFNTPVGVHFWRQVTEGVSRFVSFVDTKLALGTDKVEWAETLNTLNVTLPATPDKTTTTTAKTTWNTLLKVQKELDEWSHKDIDRVYEWITVCANRAKAFDRYRNAFSAFCRNGECNLRTSLEKTSFPATASKICKCLGALEEEHLVFIEIEVDFSNKSLNFLTQAQKFDLAKIVRGAKKKKTAQRADPPRKPLVVVLSDSKAQLEYMRACLLGV